MTSRALPSESVTSARHDVVHIIHLSLDRRDDADDLRESLNEDERRRAQLILRDVERRRFEVAHGLTRRVLARELAVAPGSIEFTESATGKPAVTGCDDLRFNVSHSGGRLVIAFARGREVGVDIEQLRPVDAVSLSRRFFSSSEAQAIAHLSGERQLQAFFRCWTRKESFVKAIGKGFACPLDSFDVAIEQPSATLVTAGRSWTITDLLTQDAFAAALTVEGGGWRLHSEAELPV